MDQALLHATVVAPFGVGDQASPPISIIGDTGVYSDDKVHLLLLCPTTALVRTNVGEVSLGSSKAHPVPGGVLTFSGSASATIPAVPFTETPKFQMLFAFSEKGESIGAGLNLHYVPQEYALKANRPFYGAVSYTKYNTRAWELLYTPEEVSGGGGFSTTYGTIAAFAQPHSITTYDVQPANQDTGAVELEIYRRVSYAVTTPEGEFEKPPGYPTSGSYPGKTLVIDVTTAMQAERVHEIGFIDSLTGYCRVQPFFVPIKEPYQGDAAYQALLLSKLECKVSNLDQLKQIDPNLMSKAKAFIKKKGYGCNA